MWSLQYVLPLSFNTTYRKKNKRCRQSWVGLESWVRERMKKIFSQGTRFRRRKKKSINEGRRGNEEVVNWIRGGLVVGLCFLVFTKEPMHVCRYQPKYWFLIMGSRIEGGKLKLTHWWLIPQDHGPFYHKGKLLKRGRRKQIEWLILICKSWIPSFHITGVFQRF